MFRNLALIFVGLSAGGIIAAGVFAFLVIIGVFPRLIGEIGTKRHILLYGTVIVTGGVLGNIADLYEFPIPMAGFSSLFLGIFGLAVGIFVGCLVMSLAETLKALQPEALSGGGTAVSDPVHCAGKTGRVPGVFSVRDGSGVMMVEIGVCGGRMVGCNAGTEHDD